MTQINRKILQFFSMMSDETRLKMLVYLTDGPKSVNQIYDAIGREKMTLSAISHQLSQMENLDIVTYEKHGRQKLFRLSEAFCWCILTHAQSHFQGGKACPVCSKIKKAKAGRKPLPKKGFTE